MYPKFVYPKKCKMHPKLPFWIALFLAFWIPLWLHVMDAILDVFWDPPGDDTCQDFSWTHFIESKLTSKSKSDLGASCRDPSDNEERTDKKEV